MTLVNLTTSLAHVPAGGALCMFTAYSVEGIAAAVDAGSATDRPVGILISAETFRSRIGVGLVAAAAEVADAVEAPICVQLDHCSDLDLMRHALELGVRSLMADGSRLDHDSNAELVAAAAHLADSFDADVEAELGRIGGAEDSVDLSDAGGATDPSAVADFVRRSRCCCLAVAVGNRHGPYPAPPQLDLALLETLAARSSVPLALHGASGLPRDQVDRAIAAGVRKINVNTELRRAAFGRASEAIDRHRPRLDWLGLSTEVGDGIREVCIDILEGLTAR